MTCPTGVMLGRYRVDGLLGQGRTGVIYRAFDTTIERTVAIKCLRPDESEASPNECALWIKTLFEEAKVIGQLNHAQATYMWQTIAPLLAPKLYPSLQAIANVYEESVRQDKDALKVNPMELWNTQHVRRIDDSGFIADLYARTPAHPEAKHAHDPEYRKEQAKKQDEVIAAVKACGHPFTMSCGCN